MTAARAVRGEGHTHRQLQSSTWYSLVRLRGCCRVRELSAKGQAADFTTLALFEKTETLQADRQGTIQTKRIQR